MGRRVLEETIQLFQDADVALRLELLLDYANRLPPLPERLRAASARGMGRVAECQTPVWLFVEEEGGQVRVYAEVAEEAPTVRGFVAILAEAYQGATAAELAAVPEDLIERLGLSALLRMTREAGLHAILWRLKREGVKLAQGSAGGDPTATRESVHR
jgi:cysteine desulfuration protein SufE